MGVLQRFERRLEGLVSGAFAKAFKSEVQPVEIASALQRECDDRAAIVGRGRTMVPNDFDVELSQHDFDRLSGYAEPLGAELAAMLHEHAQENRYSFIGPVAIRFELAEDLEIGMFRVRSQAVPGAQQTGGAHPAPPQQAQAWLEVNGVPQPLTKAVTSIGRGLDVDLRVEDPGVSRRHAEVRLGPTAAVVDLGSTNGMVVDGRQVLQAVLEDGSTIVLGNTTLVFRRGGA